MEKKWFLYILLFIGILTISFSAIFIKMSESTPLVIATYRMGISSLILLPIFILKKKKIEREGYLFLLSGIFLALHFYTWITSLKFTTIMSSTVLVTTNPIFVSIFSYFLFKKRLKIKTFLAIILSIFGIFLMSYVGEFSANIKGNSLALIGAIFASLYIITNYSLRKKYDLINIIFRVYLISFFVLLSLSLILKENLIYLQKREFFLLFLIALLPQVIGHSIINFSLKFFSPIFISLTILGEPIGATLLGIIFFNEIPKTLEILGAILIILGITISEKE
ncbi:MAG: DMT family transporter [Caldisericia bacterium]|nr:DMT family transporter [Caldisericia bacterium]